MGMTGLEVQVSLERYGMPEQGGLDAGFKMMGSVGRGCDAEVYGDKEHPFPPRKSDQGMPDLDRFRQERGACGRLGAGKVGWGRAGVGLKPLRQCLEIDAPDEKMAAFKAAPDLQAGDRGLIELPVGET